MVYYTYDAEEYDTGRDENIPFWIDEARRLARLEAPALILDLGCGTGTYALRLHDAVRGQTYGLDPSVEMLKVGQLKSIRGAVNWVRGIAECLTFRDDLFDCVFSSQVWHHLYDKSKAAKECYRVLKPHSPLIIRTISPDQWRECTERKFFPEIVPSQLRVYPSLRAFQALLSAAGFTRIDLLPYRLTRYTSPRELIEVAEKNLCSMFQYVYDEN
jgi:ubiquinone/menaquinone biosynthesis C-methylase UbiE